jgi:DNA-binding NarL/FixJ family response regulator
MNPPTARILLADDHDVVRKGLRAMLEARENWKVCGEATTGKEAIDMAASLRPDIAVLDLEMAELDGMEATRGIKKNCPEVEVLIFTMHDSDYLIREVLAAGARAFVLKSEGGGKLVEAIDAVLEHKPFFAARAAETLLQSIVKNRTAGNEPVPLTNREYEVVRLLSSGKSNKETAAMLGISVKTVETHRARIMRKLEFNSVAELVRYAVRERLIKA